MRGLALPLLIVGLFIASARSASADSISGRVSRVSDGDTFTIVDKEKIEHRVRLSSIDAPEKNQLFGKQAKQGLGKLIGGKDVKVEIRKRDNLGRVSGRVLVAGKDVGLQMLKDGLAWHYKRFKKDQAQKERKSYESAEASARSGKKGLWRDPGATPPWTYRVAQRKQTSGGANRQPASQ